MDTSTEITDKEVEELFDSFSHCYGSVGVPLVAGKTRSLCGTKVYGGGGWTYYPTKTPCPICLALAKEI